MKNCDEMFNSLIERREAYKVKQKRTKKIVLGFSTGFACVLAIGLAFAFKNIDFSGTSGANNHLPDKGGEFVSDVLFQNDRFVATIVEPISGGGSTADMEWLRVDEKYLKEKTDRVVRGKVESVKEVKINYDYLDQHGSCFYTLMEVKVEDDLYGNDENTTIKVLYDVTTHRGCCSENGDIPQVGEEHYFFLESTDCLRQEVIDYSQLAEYFFILPPPAHAKVGEESIVIKNALSFDEYGNMEDAVKAFFNETVN